RRDSRSGRWFCFDLGLWSSGQASQEKGKDDNTAECASEPNRLVPHGSLPGRCRRNCSRGSTGWVEPRSMPLVIQLRLDYSTCEPPVLPPSPLGSPIEEAVSKGRHQWQKSRSPRL